MKLEPTDKTRIGTGNSLNITPGEEVGNVARSIIRCSLLRQCDRYNHQAILCFSILGELCDSSTKSKGIF